MGETIKLNNDPYRIGYDFAGWIVGTSDGKYMISGDSDTGTLKLIKDAYESDQITINYDYLKQVYYSGKYEYVV